MSITDSFIDPPPQTHPGDYSYASIIPYGSPHEFSWTDNYDIPLNLVLVQETYFVDNNSLQPKLDTLAYNLTNTSYVWDGKPSSTQDLSLSNVFWLAIYNASNESNGPLFTSEYFNVTSSSSSSTTSSSSTITSSSSTSSSSSSSSSSSTPAAQPNTTPTSTTTAAISPTPTNTAKSNADHVALGAGLGVGLGGAALILTGAIFFFLSRKRHSKGRNSRTPEVYQLAENDRFSH